MKREDILVLGGFALFIVLVVFGCHSMAKEQAECNARGGVYVRQAIGYGCMGGR